MAEDLRTVKSADGIREFDRGYELPARLMLGLGVGL